MSCLDGWIAWFNLAGYNVVMKIKATFGGLLFEAKNQQSELEILPHPNRKTIFSSFEAQTIGKVASPLEKENMISRSMEWFIQNTF